MAAKHVITGGQKEKIGPRKWRIRVSLGKDPQTGKYRRSKSRIVVGNSKDADAALAAYRAELQAALDAPDGGITFGEYAEGLFEAREALGGSPLSRKRERNEVDKLIELFGDVPLGSLTPGLIKKRYLAAAKSGMTAATLKRISKRLRAILEDAVGDDLLQKNPATKVKVAEPVRHPPKSLSKSEATRLTACLASSALSSLVVAIRLMLYGGLRRGEALGLTWRHVDFEHSAIFIAQQYSDDLELRPPKSLASRRWVTLDGGTMDMLARWRECQSQALPPELTFHQSPDTPVVVSQAGGFWDPTNFNRSFRSFCVQYGFGEYTEASGDNKSRPRKKKKGYKGLTPHGLRHTHATLLIGERVDIKTVSTRLGHSSVSLTLNVYADAIRQNDVVAATSIESMLGGDSAIAQLNMYEHAAGKDEKDEQ